MDCGVLKTPVAESIMQYNSHQDILLVGEGDFSFAVSLAKAFGGATNMVATSRDFRSSVVRKFYCGEKNLEKLEEYGCTVLHGVDVHSMVRHPDLKGRFFDVIVFNFPHAGIDSENIGQFFEDQIRRHRKLVSGFLMNASSMLSCAGQIHVTLENGYLYSQRRLTELAEEVGLMLLDEAKFSKSDYPGYQNKIGYGWFSNMSFSIGSSSTFMFVEKE